MLFLVLSRRVYQVKPRGCGIPRQGGLPGCHRVNFFQIFFWTSATERRSLLFMVMKLMSFAETDPVLAAIHAAPVVEASAEEMAAFEEGLAEIHAGRAISATQIRQKLDSLANQ